jgi:hypothetical protein
VTRFFQSDKPTANKNTIKGTLKNHEIIEKQSRASVPLARRRAKRATPKWREAAPKWREHPAPVWQAGRLPYLLKVNF